MENESDQLNEELVIDSSNFNEYFFDVRKFGPKKDQVLAKFTAFANFSDGPEKKDLIKILQRDKAESAALVMRKIHGAREPDCYNVCKQICEDLMSGMSEEEVSKKDYEFVLEAFYYVEPHYVPADDPHWELINLVKFDEETKTFTCQV